MPISPMREDSSLLTHAAEIPVNARRPDWERRGSRELAIFLRRRHHAPLADEMRFLDALFRRAMVRNRTARARRERLYEAFSALAAPLAAHRERWNRACAGCGARWAALTDADVLTAARLDALERVGLLESPGGGATPKPIR